MESPRANELQDMIRAAVDRGTQVQEESRALADEHASIDAAVRETIASIQRRRMTASALRRQRLRAVRAPAPGGTPSPMASEGNTTTDHDEIRRWAEERDGTPATVRGTANGDDAGVLRIDFPGGAGEDRLEPISWDDWFGKFDASDLAFVHQEHKASGEGSTFFKLVGRGG